MDIQSIPSPKLEEIFCIEVEVAAPIVVGQDTDHGRRQLIIITGGKVTGKLQGKCLPGGVDSQIIRANGLTELEARYAIQLDNGDSFYIENKGLRRVDPAWAPRVAQGEFAPPEAVYFATVPTFETYSPELRWLEESIFICYAARLPDKVLLRYFQVV